jgi:multicomponent Na+:H+ antiporter subunit A
MIYSLFMVYKIFTGIGGTIYLFSEPVLSLDKLGLFALVFIQILSFVILIFSLYGVSPETEKRFFILYPLTLAFSNGVAASINSISFIIFWGLSGLTLYLFATINTSGDGPKTAKKTFIIAGGSDAFMIMGFVIMSRLATQGGYSLNNLHIPLNSGVSYLAFFFLLIAALAKAGGFPLHTWVPDFSKDSPVESAALLPAANDKLLGIYLLARMMTEYFSVPLVINMVIVSLGAITVITAVMMALYQHNGRKLLGYHAVSQVGYMYQAGARGMERRQRQHRAKGSSRRFRGNPLAQFVRLSAADRRDHGRDGDQPGVAGRGEGRAKGKSLNGAALRAPLSALDAASSHPEAPLRPRSHPRQYHC